MPKFIPWGQKGVVHLLVPIILLLGIIGVVYLVTSGPLKLFPKAASTPVGPEASFTLSSNLSSVKAGDKLGIKLLVRSDIETANLFEAKLTFDNSLLAVESIDYSSSFIRNWVEQYSDNSTGTISLVGGVPNPGVQTSLTGIPLSMAVIYFNVLKTSPVTINFLDTSAIYSNATNLNILNQKNGVTIGVGSSSPTATLRPSPSVGVGSSSPTATPIPGTGDGNGDGKVTLVDLSVLLSDFNKTGSIRKGIDMNGDGLINTFDFSLMRNLLISKGVIRG